MHYSKPLSWRIPVRLAPAPDWLTLGLSSALLVVSIAGVRFNDDLPLLAYVSSLALIGLSNLSLALADTLPEAQGGRAAREAIWPLVMLMALALVATVALLLIG